MNFSIVGGLGGVFVGAGEAGILEGGDLGGNVVVLIAFLPEMDCGERGDPGRDEKNRNGTV